MKLLTVDGQWWDAVDHGRATDALNGDGRSAIEVKPLMMPHSPDTAHLLRHGGYVAARHVVAWGDDPDDE